MQFSLSLFDSSTTSRDRYHLSIIHRRISNLISKVDMSCIHKKKSATSRWKQKGVMSLGRIEYNRTWRKFQRAVRQKNSESNSSAQKLSRETIGSSSKITRRIDNFRSAMPLAGLCRKDGQLWPFPFYRLGQDNVKIREVRVNDVAWCFVWHSNGKIIYNKTEKKRKKHRKSMRKSRFYLMSYVFHMDEQRK